MRYSVIEEKGKEMNTDLHSKDVVISFLFSHYHLLFFTHILMTLVKTPNTKLTTTKPTQPDQWQTRVRLRSNEGYRYEMDRQILVESRWLDLP